MMRRLIIRRGLTALAGLALSGGSAKVPTMAFPYASDMSPPRASRRSLEQDQRDVLAQPFRDQIDALEKRRHARYRAFNDIDPDLQVLHSTSSCWRASVMYDRHRERDAPLDRLRDRLNAIWEEPLEKLQSMIAGWINDV